jgi:hypothetical protein
MKLKKLIHKLYEACIEHHTELEKKIYMKIMKKSLKKKDEAKTKAVQ